MKRGNERGLTMPPPNIFAQEMGHRNTDLGPVLYVKFRRENYQLIGWRELWEAFAERYPGQWAVQVFPPKEELVDEENIYHLFVMEHKPAGLSIKR
jgi:hypothetical protein